MRKQRRRLVSTSFENFSNVALLRLRNAAATIDDQPEFFKTNSVKEIHLFARTEKTEKTQVRRQLYLNI